MSFHRRRLFLVVLPYVFACGVYFNTGCGARPVPAGQVSDVKAELTDAELHRAKVAQTAAVVILVFAAGVAYAGLLVWLTMEIGAARKLDKSAGHGMPPDEVRTDHPRPKGLMERLRRQYGSQTSEELTAESEKRLHPKSPWLWWRPWQTGVIRPHLPPRFLQVAFGAFLVLSGFLAIMLARTVLHPDPANPMDPYGAVILSLVALLMPGVGTPFLLMLTAARHRDPGLVFQMETLPGLIGGPVRGTTHIPKRMVSARGLELCLRCVRGGALQTFWETREHVSTDKLQTDGAANLVPVDFLVPSDLPPSDAPGPRASTAWRLIVRKRWSFSFDLEFRIPVFRTRESRPDIPLTPKTFQVLETGIGTTLRFKPEMPLFSLVLIMPLMAIWDAVVLFGAVVIVWNGDYPFLLFLIPFVVAGIALPYWVLANTIGRTDVIVSSAELRVRHHPLPLFRDPRYSPGDIVRVYLGQYDKVCIEDRHHKSRTLDLKCTAWEAALVAKMITEKLGLKGRSTRSAT